MLILVGISSQMISLAWGVRLLLLNSSCPLEGVPAPEVILLLMCVIASNAGAKQSPAASHLT
ncbi:MAG: hypothetical protein KatS3mg022_0998 [Armatimonadota bacterium]|nr:MAG: hypothetical protein KatS3mg022_0998 [Armatimonadota bacterium]